MNVVYQEQHCIIIYYCTSTLPQFKNLIIELNKPNQAWAFPGGLVVRIQTFTVVAQVRSLVRKLDPNSNEALLHKDVLSWSGKRKMDLGWLLKNCQEL